MEHIKYKLEFDMKATPITILWDYISSENGLKQWFADGVKIKDREYIFTWKGYSQEARLVGMRKGLAIKLQLAWILKTALLQLRVGRKNLSSQVLNFAKKCKK